MKDEALRKALNFVEDVYLGEWSGPTERQEEVIAAIKQALEQSVADSNTSQKPVAKIEKTQHEPFAWYVDFGNEDEPNYLSLEKPDEPIALIRPLYTSQLKEKNT